MTTMMILLGRSSPPWETLWVLVLRPILKSSPIRGKKVEEVPLSSALRPSKLPMRTLGGTWYGAM